MLINSYVSIGSWLGLIMFNYSPYIWHSLQLFQLTSYYQMIPNLLPLNLETEIFKILYQYNFNNIIENPRFTNY